MDLITEFVTIVTSVLGPEDSADFRVEGAWDGELELTWTGVPEGRRVAKHGPNPDRPTLVQLAATTIQLRVARGNEIGERQERIAELRRRSPTRFDCHLGFRGGRFDLIEAANSMIDDAGESPRWHEVKEKFGGVRLYGADRGTAAEEIERCAEELSFCICDVCGAPGMLRDESGWLRTRCHDHVDTH